MDFIWYLKIFGHIITKQNYIFEFDMSSFVGNYTWDTRGYSPDLPVTEGCWN